MTWSYSGNPADSTRDHLRFLIGDTDTNDQQLSNEELDFLIAQNATVVQAALGACDVLIAKYARLADQRTGDIDIKYSQRLKAYQDLKASLPLSPAAGDDAQVLPYPYVGGISQADMETVQDDEDRVGPVFAMGMMDNPSDVPTGSGGTGGVL